MLGPFIVVLIVLALLLIVVGTTGRRSLGRSTAGHYDPDAIGGSTLDPATMRYRYDLPTLPPGASPMATSGGPPHRRRLRRRRPDAERG